MIERQSKCNIISYVVNSQLSVSPDKEIQQERGRSGNTIST